MFPLTSLRIEMAALRAAHWCLLGVTIALVAILAARDAAAGTLTEDVPLSHGGITRYFDVYEPDSLPASGAPLLLLLHGGTGSNDSLHTGAAAEYFSLADQDGFLLLLPNATSSTTGLSDPTGSFNWNDCRNDAGPASTSADDVGFLSALIDWAIAHHGIDSERVYATGASNGGMMSYRLALELSDRIAAIGAVVAGLPVNSECPDVAANPISVLIMNGSGEDFYMPWSGGQVAGNRGLVRSAADTREYWRAALGLPSQPSHVRLPDLDATDGGRAVLDQYCGGTDGTSLAFFTMEGAGHNYPSIAYPISEAAESRSGKQNHDIESAHEIWKFLERQRLHGHVATCGDLCVDPGETCDDGNLADGDCCAANCQAAAACPTCETCDLDSGACGSIPRPTCHTETMPGRSRLALTNGADPKQDRFSWRWTNGEETLASEFGNPSAGDAFAVCIFDESGTNPALVFRTKAPGSAACDDDACWTTATNGSLRFRSRSTLPEGLKQLRIQPASDGHASFTVQGAGPALSGRDGGLPAFPFPTPLRVQLQASNGACWESRVSEGAVLRNDGKSFQARTD